MSMLELSKNILEKVSFDKFLFQKELIKAIHRIKTDEIPLLKAWCLSTFDNYNELISDVFKTVSTYISEKIYV